MVHVDQVTQLMKNNISHKMFRKVDKIYVEVNVLFYGAAPPVGNVVFKKEPVITERGG